MSSYIASELDSRFENKIKYINRHTQSILPIATLHLQYKE